MNFWTSAGCCVRELADQNWDDLWYFPAPAALPSVLGGRRIAKREQQLSDCWEFTAVSPS
jgi:hypothetical protein